MEHPAAADRDGAPLFKPLPRRPNQQRQNAPATNGLGIDSAEAPANSQSRSLREPPTPFAFLAPYQHAPDSPPLTDSDGFLSPHNANFEGSKSRSRSIVNLTSSTLFGIYGEPATDPSSPFGNGAETPLSTWNSQTEEGSRGSISEMSGDARDLNEGSKGEGLGDVHSGGYLEARRRPPTGYEVSRRLREGGYYDNSHSRRTSAISQQEDQVDDASIRHSTKPRLSPWESTSSWTRIILRSILLFTVGVGYGAMIATLPIHGDMDELKQYVEKMMKEKDTFVYLMSWGAAGVILGTMLPVVDRVVDGWRVNRREQKAISTPTRKEGSLSSRRGNRRHHTVRVPSRSEADIPETPQILTTSSFMEEFSPAIRSIGAFLGIAFAIRKLQWETALQLSATLALTNPCLWYLLDRTSAGLVVACVVAGAGSAMVIGFGARGAIPIPIPEGMSGQVEESLLGLGTQANHSDRGDLGRGVNGNLSGSNLGGISLGDVVWVMSVLFWSSVCFGAIGRLMRSKNRSR
jgi:hypothetical protein